MAFQQHPRSVLTPLRAKIPPDVLSRAQQRLAEEQLETASDEMAGVYLPLALLIRERIAAHQAVNAQSAQALGAKPIATPYIIGLAGGVASGKSTSARLLHYALAAWPESSNVALVNGDGFLFPNARLEELGLMDRKGFPESYDHEGLINFLTQLKSGAPMVSAPLYSHTSYDVLPGEAQIIHSPHIVILEGIHVLQPRLSGAGGDHLTASDFFDYSIYIHADEAHIKQWFTTRFLALTEAAANDPQSFYSRFASLSAADRIAVAEFVWNSINGKNLKEYILPTRWRADLVLNKGPSHEVTHFELRNA